MTKSTIHSCVGLFALVISSTVLPDRGLAQTAGTGFSTQTIIPADATLVFESPEFGSFMNRMLRHPSLKTALNSKEGKQLLVSQQLLPLQIGVALLESQVGKPWNEIVSHVTAGGVSGYLSTETGRLVVVMHGDDEAVLKKTVGVVLNFANSQAESEGKKAPFRISEVDSIKIAESDGGCIARTGATLVIANQKQAAYEAALAIKSSLPSVNPDATEARYIEATKGVDPESDLRIYANLDQIRESGAARRLFSGMADNPAVELLVGGILESLKESRWAIAALKLNDDSIDITVASEMDEAKVSAGRQYFFGNETSNSIPPLVGDQEWLFHVSTHRDLSGWWMSKEELFDDAVAAQLAQADSQLSTLFSGLDFGGEVLGAIEPRFEIVGDVQEFGEKEKPAIEIPEFALIARLKEPEEMGRRFKVAYQSVMGFVNLGLSQQGQPQFDINARSVGSDIECVSSVFDEVGAARDLLIYNFSPTLIVRGDRIVLGSTERIAMKSIRTMAVSGGEREDASESRLINTSLSLDVDRAAELVKRNRETLEVQSMLDDGISRAAARRNINNVLALMSLVRQAKLNFEVRPDRVILGFSLELETNSD